MEVLCVTNDAAQAPGDRLDKLSHPEYVHTDLDVGKIYRVYAMVAYADRISYLVDAGRPKWKSAVFFSVVDDSLPAGWRFRFSPEPPFPVLERRWVQAVWGYDYLLDHFPSHYNGLWEQEPADVAVFREEVNRRSAEEEDDTRSRKERHS